MKRKLMKYDEAIPEWERESTTMLYPFLVPSVGTSQKSVRIAVNLRLNTSTLARWPVEVLVESTETSEWHSMERFPIGMDAIRSK